jgi:two-component system sensor histidine kinase PilS (NtrC family)
MRTSLLASFATVGQLAAGIAHEIRNPLASLSGSIQLMKGELTPSETTDKLMTIILRETDRLDHLLQNFLNYAKPSSLYLQHIRLCDLCNEVVSLIKNSPELKARDVEIEVKINSNLEAECDPKQLRQIFWNLLNNSVQAIIGKGRIKISAEEIQNDGHPAILFSVEDNGTGISKTALNKIFDPFYTTKATGTGLGLALVYQMVKTHGGRVGVESDEGKGTRIWFEFPKNGRLQADAEREMRAAG